MKACPRCAQSPHWHYARNVSQTRKVDHFSFAGCLHAEAFAHTLGLVPAKERGAVEARWDAHAEAMFADYTARWSQPQRVAFRARLWPAPVPVVPYELFDRNKDEAPRFRHACDPRDEEPQF